jgi:hypothetical protein
VISSTFGNVSKSLKARFPLLHEIAIDALSIFPNEHQRRTHVFDCGTDPFESSHAIGAEERETAEPIAIADGFFLRNWRHTEPLPTAFTDPLM